MKTLLDVETEVVGVDLSKVKEAFALLGESGLKEETLKSMSYSLGFTQCEGCERIFPDSDFQDRRLPGWSPPYDQNVRRVKREKLRLVERPLNWERQRQAVESVIGDVWDRSKHFCPECIDGVIDSKLDDLVQHLKSNRKVQTYFLHGVLDSILIMIRSDEKYKHNFTENVLYTGYVALVNGLMQRIPVEGNKVAYRYLIESARLLRMI